MLEGLDCFRDHLVVTERDLGLPRLRIMRRDGTSIHVPFTEAVCEAYLGPNAEFDTTLLRYHYQSLVTPMSVFEYDTGTGTSTLLKRTEVLGGYDPVALRERALLGHRRRRGAGPGVAGVAEGPAP